jgi:hypothetical protein
MTKRFLKPAPDRRVLMPAMRTPMPEEGLAVDWSKYWQRRLDDGDVVETKPKKTTTANSTPGTKE